MKSFFENPQYQLLLIGGVVSFVSTLIGMFAQALFNSFLSRKGKLKLYIKSVYSRVNGKPWGFDLMNWASIFKSRCGWKFIIRNL